MPELQIPFMTGQHEEVDARVAPDGTLHAVKELVTKRQGRWEKRKEYVELTNTATGIPTLAGEIWSLGQHRSDRLIAYGQPPRLAVHSPDLDAITATAQLALPAFNAPQRYPIPHELGDDTAEVIQTDIVYLNGWTVVLWVIGTTARVGWIEESTKTLTTVSPAFTITTSTAKLCKAGDYVVLAYPTSSTEISARVWLSTGTSQPAFGSATVVASGLTNVGGFALAEFRGTSNFLLAGVTLETTTTEADLYVYDPASLGSPVESSLAVVVQNQTGSAYLAIDGNSGEGVLFAFRYEGAGDGIAYMHLNDDLTSNLAYTAIASSANFRKAPSLLQLTSTSWLVMSDDNASSPDPYDVGSVETWIVTTAGGTTGPTNHYDVRPVSELFGITDSAGNVRPYVVAVSDNDTNSSGGLPFTRSYYLLAIATATFLNHVDSLRPQGYFARDVGVVISANYNQLPKVVSDGSGGFLFAGPYIAQGTALDRNDFVEDYRLATAVWRWSSTSRGDRLKAVSLGQAAYLSGGILTRWDGSRATEAGFLRRPDITRLIATSTGAMTADAEYSYLAVFESITGDGEVVRSEPSLPATITLDSGSGEDGVEVKLRDNKLRANNPFATTPEQRIYLYRTLANQPGVYYMVHAQDDPIIGYGIGTVTEVAYTDNASDATISDRPIIYSAADGTGLLPNATPPPCRYIAVVGKRLVCGGTEIPEEVWVSAESVSGEQVNFKDDPAFKVRLPAPCTAVGELDGYPVLFTASSIHMLMGIGPDDTGSGLFEERQIPTDAGAVAGHVVTTDEGVVYQSDRGIELLPRGFGAPQWVGSPVADALGSALVTGMVSVGDDVRCSYSGGVLVWNTTWNAWSVFEVGSVFSSAVWDGLHVLGYEDYAETVPIALEVNTTPTTYIGGRIETKDLTIGMIAGYYRAEECIALFEYRGQARVTIAISYDSGLSFPDTLSFDLSSGTYSVGQVVAESFTLPWQKSDRFRFRISDSGYAGGTTGTDGVRFLGMTLSYKVKRGLKRLREGQKG